MKTLNQEEINNIQPPDFSWLALTIQPITNGKGDNIDLNALLEEFQTEFEKTLTAAQNHTELPESFFIPDLWHIAKGKAKSVPPGEGEKLWQAQVDAIHLANTFYPEREITSRHNYPGTNCKRNP